MFVQFLVTITVGMEFKKALTYGDVWDCEFCSDAMTDRCRRDVEACCH